MAGGLAVIAGSFLYPYADDWIRHITPGCLFRRLTGVPCLLCGMTRSMAAAAHGDLEGSFRLHLLGPPLFFLAIAGTVILALETLLGRAVLPRPGKEARRAVARAVLAVLVAAWVLRLFIFGVGDLG